MDQLQPSNACPEGVGDHQRGDALATALEHSRFELVPTEGVEEQADHLPKGTRVTVGVLSRGIEHSLQIIERLTRRGLRVVPHLPARRVTDEWHLEEILRRLEDLGIEELLVVGGDPKQPVGPYRDALGFLSAMSDRGHNFSRVNIGGYPEGHPDIDDEVLLRVLLDKQPFATHIVTQMCFDPEKIVAWIAGIRRRGVRLPVLVGVPGVVEIKRLLRISHKIGVGDSTRFLRKHAGLAGLFFSSFFESGSYNPDALVGELVPYIGDPDYNIVGFHIYTFNQVESAERWHRTLLNPAQGATRPAIPPAPA
ncbi:MAG: methylenetetrahydrofolate reductase [Rubrobacteraceae bacterium]